MSRGRLAIGFVCLALALGVVYLVYPSDWTLGVALAAAIPLVWLAAGRGDGPPGPSQPGPWSGP